MNEGTQCDCIHAIQEGGALVSRVACLGDQRLSQRVVTTDEEFVSRMQALQVSLFRQPGRFAVHSTITLPARQHQILDAIKRALDSQLKEYPRKEVVDVGKFRVGSDYRDFSEAVKASALLIAIQRAAALGNHGAPTKLRGGQNLAVALDADHQSFGQAQFPRSFHQAPTRLDLVRQVAELRRLPHLKQLVRETNPAPSSLTLVDKEPNRNLAAVHDVKGVDHIVEAQGDGLIHQFCLRQLAGVGLTAGLKEPAAG